MPFCVTASQAAVRIVGILCDNAIRIIAFDFAVRRVVVVGERLATGRNCAEVAVGVVGIRDRLALAIHPAS